MKQLDRTLALAGMVVAVLSWATNTNAQSLVYSQNFETDDTANWLINYGTGDNVADIYFDYSKAGIPPAPHSTGTTTRGLKLQANVNPLTQDGLLAGYGLSVSPMNFSITENFEMRFDMWLNYIPVATGNTATYIGGAGFGTAGTQAQRAMPSAGVVDSIFIGASTDGNTTADYRVYSPRFYTGLQDASGVYLAGSRNNTATYYTTNFPGGIAPPAAQTNLFPSQTSVRTPDGTLAFKWRDVSLKKVANIITYRIDGVLIAAIDASTNGDLGGANILFNCYDINANASVDPLATNLLFVLFDNVRITNFPSVVSVTAATAEASESGAVAGKFTIMRNEPGPEVNVYYTMGGTAQSGQDYAALPGVITLPAGATQADITLTPTDDTEAEFAESAVISINDGTNYVGAGTATINIADNETPAVDVAVVQASMYERLPQDRVRFRLVRRGNLNAASFNVNLNYGGSAAKARHTATSPVTIDPGAVNIDFDVNPINDGLYQGDETIVLSVAGGSGYTVGTNTPTATATIVDDELPVENVIFSDNFNTDSSAQYNVFFGSNLAGDTDYDVKFAYDYNFFPYATIPPAPHSGTDTRGLYLSVNKFDLTEAAAALNIYPKNKTFSGNFAVRFDMFLVIPSASPTEYALFGINHSGARTNWFRNTTGGLPAGWTLDGLFFGVEADAAALGDYVLYTAPTTSSNTPTTLTSRLASSLTGIFKAPPYSNAGAPSNLASSETKSWAEVEMRQEGDVVTLRINNTTILSYTNATAVKSGNIMLGFADAYDSIGGPEGGVFFDNLRVVQLASASRPVITGIKIAGSNVEITFTGDAADSTASFKLQESAVATGGYADVDSTITGASGTFRATRAVAGQSAFYRVRRN